MRNAFILLVLAAVALLPGVGGAATFDLASAVDRTLRFNPEIASRRIAIDEAKKELGKAGGLFLPTITASQQLSTLSASDSLLNSRNYPDESSKITNLRLSQPLFTGFAGLNTLDKVKYIREYRECELHEAQLGLIRQVQRQFYDYLRLVEDVASFQETIVGLEEQLKAAKAFFEQYMAPELQVLQAEVRLSTARQDLVQIQTQASNARRRLHELLALPAGEADAEYSGRLSDFDCQGVSPLADYAERAKTRPDLRMANINIALARKEAKIILGRSLPRVTVDADYYDRDVRYDARALPGYNEDYWTLGLNVSINLFQGGADAAAYGQQMLAASRHQEDLRKLSNQIDRELETSHASLREAALRIDSALRTKEVAVAALDRAKTAFELGLGTTITVLDAQRDVNQAMTGISKARADFLSSRADLEYLAAMDETYAAAMRPVVAPVP